MDNETYQKYDRMVQATLINIYTMSKDDNKVILVNFDPKTDTDKCVVEIAKISQSLWNFDIEVDLPLFKFLMFKIKNKDARVKRYKKYSEKKVDVQELKMFVSKAYVETTMIYKKIYDTYYNPKTRKVEEE